MKRPKRANNEGMETEMAILDGTNLVLGLMAVIIAGLVAFTATKEFYRRRCVKRDVRANWKHELPGLLDRLGITMYDGGEPKPDEEELQK